MNKGQVCCPLAHLHVALLDINDEPQAVKVATDAVEKFGFIDVLANNAGFGLQATLRRAITKAKLNKGRLIVNFRLSIRDHFNVQGRLPATV